MSPLTIDAAGMALILKNVASDMKEHREELWELDSKVGDGDLGVTIELVSKALSEYLTTTNEKDIGNLLAQCGMSINRANPSTFATILASAFMGGGKAVMGKTEIGPPDLVLIGEGAIANIQKRGRAEVGGKTLLDTIVPAVIMLKKEMGGLLLKHLIILIQHPAGGVNHADVIVPVIPLQRPGAAFHPQKADIHVASLGARMNPGE